MKGRHIQPESTILVNGFLVDGSVSCQEGELPDCTDELISVELNQVPTRYGLNFLQDSNARRHDQQRCNVLFATKRQTVLFGQSDSERRRLYLL